MSYKLYTRGRTMTYENGILSHDICDSSIELTEEEMKDFSIIKTVKFNSYTRVAIINKKVKKVLPYELDTQTVKKLQNSDFVVDAANGKCYISANEGKYVAVINDIEGLRIIDCQRNSVEIIKTMCDKTRMSILLQQEPRPHDKEILHFWLDGLTETVTPAPQEAIVSYYPIRISSSNKHCLIITCQNDNGKEIQLKYSPNKHTENNTLFAELPYSPIEEEVHKVSEIIKETKLHNAVSADNELHIHGKLITLIKKKGEHKWRIR